MASRKNLKKSIKLISSELFADCVALSMCNASDKEALAALMADILNVEGEYVARISHTEKGQERLFYKKLREEFTAKANEISDKIIKA